MLKNFLTQLKTGTEYLNYGRDIVVSMASNYTNKLPNQDINILDIGFGNGCDLLNIKKALNHQNVFCYGIDSFVDQINLAQKLGVTAYLSNIEFDSLPFQESFFDIVVANQIIEHTKEIFWIFSEISRVLKPGGIWNFDDRSWVVRTISKPDAIARLNRLR